MEGDTYQDLLDFDSAYRHELGDVLLPSNQEEPHPVTVDTLNSPTTENVLKETSTHIKDWGPFWNEDESLGITRDPEKIIRNEGLIKSSDIHRKAALKRELTEEEIMADFAHQEEQFELLRMQPPEKVARVVNKRVFSPVIGCIPPPGQAGLEHLSHLVCLMEQLSKLHEQNTKLKRRCVYLKDTQLLLRLQNKHLLNQPVRKDSRARIRPRGTMASLKSPKQKKGYISDSSDGECLPAMEPRNKMKLAQRSLSVGSINVIDLEKPVGKTEKGKETKRLESVFSRSVLTSKWERVKKVFSGKPETPTKAEPTTITAEQLVRANSRQSSSSVRHISRHHHHHHHHRTLTSSKSYDGGALLPFVGEDLYFEYNLDRTNDFTPQSPISICSSDTPIPSVVTEPYEGTPTADSGLELEAQGSSMGSSVLSEESESRVHPYATRPGSDDDHLHHTQYLSVVNHMRRRQSSPALSMQEEAMRHDQLTREHSAPSPRLSRSSSFRSNKADAPNPCSTPEPAPPASEEPTRPRDKVRSTRSAWGRVKDIIHTRKDSLKRRNRRSHSAGDALPDGSISDGEYFLKRDYTDDDNWDLETSAPQSSSPKRRIRPRGSTMAYSQPTSPERGRQPSPIGQDSGTKFKPSTPATPMDVPGLSGCLSEEFCKKLQDWEEKKKKGILTKDSSVIDWDYEPEKEEEEFSEEFIRKMEEWERIKGHNKATGSPAPTGGCSSPDGGLPQSPNSQDHQLSDAFTRKVKEWERVKTQRLKDSSSPSIDMGGGGLARTATEKRSRRKDRSKSRDRERDRSRSKFDRQREKELKLIEKTQQKIEKEREKLGKMKKRLEEIETMGQAEVQGLSQEFTRKLQEWEVKKGLRSDVDEVKGERDRGVGDGCSPSSSPYPQRSATVKHSRSNSAKTYKEKAERERTQSMCFPEGMDIAVQPELPPEDLDFYTPWASATRSSSVPLFPMVAADAKDECTSIDLNLTSSRTPGQDECTSIDLNLTSDTTPGQDDSTSIDLNLTADKPRLLEGKDECTSIDLNLTTETSESLPELETQYKAELSQRDEDISGLQHEISELTDRINEMSQQHQQQIEHYKRELWVSSQSGHHTIQSDLISANLGELREDLEKLQATHQHTDGTTAELQGLLAQEVEAKMAAEQKIIKNIGAQDESLQEQDQDASFDKLCNFLRKLHTQLGELKLGVGERNSLLRVLQQQLVCQEVNNRLLEVELQRRHMEVSYLRDARWSGVMRRTKTFGGTDFIQRGECISYGSTHNCLKASPHRMSSFEDPRNNLKYCTGSLEELNLTWLDEIQTHRNLLKAPPPIETHETQTEGADALDTAVQTNLSLCAKIEAIRNSPSGQNSTLSRPGKREGRAYIGSVSTPGIFPMPTPVKAPRIKHIAFGSTELPARADRLPVIKSRCSEDVTYTFNITPSPESSRHSSFKSSRPMSDGVCIEKGHSDDSKNIKSSELTQSAGSVDDCEQNGTHLPLSPVIRSRNPRKLKTEVSATTAAADPRTWKATPPKRTYRHRKHSAEKKPDTTGTLSKSKDALVVNGETSEFKVVKVCSTSPTLKSIDMLKPPAERFSRTPSPTNIRHRPLHRLKTADELLHESETLKRSRKHSHKSGGGSTERPNSTSESPSQGKENSMVDKIKEQLSRESSPDKYTNVVKDKLPQDSVRLAVRRLSSPTTEHYEFTPPLKDLTNESGKVRKIKEGLLEKLSPDKASSSKSARISERPKEGIVSKRAELYESKNSPDDKDKSPSSSKLSLPPQSTPPCQRQDSKSSSKSTGSTRSKSPSPTPKERKVHRLFQRKYGSPSMTDDIEEGAVSKLCRQAVSVSVEDEDEEIKEEEEAEEEKEEKVVEDPQKKKTFNWLQKPKKFFKVSNMHDLDPDLDCGLYRGDDPGDTDSEYLAESQSGFLAEYFSDINLDDQSEDSLTTASLEWFSSCEEISFLN